MTDRTIKVRLEAEVSQYQKNMDEAAKATELLAAKSDVAAKKVDYAAKVQETAASKVKAAEESLKKVRSDSKATADQVRAAEENLAKAKLDESSASLTLRESTQQLEAAQRAQGDAADIQTSKMKRAGAFWKENRADIDKTATSLMVVGGAGVGALGLMTKQAISWESAWAGVTKTVNATDAELASLQAGLRQMATELPATHEEIAAVAEAAGQLGIQTPNILGFTRTIIDLGEATNIVGEEGAKNIAQFMNIMQTSQGDVGRLGSTIVALGNNFATTESDILALSMRLAGAGKQAGLTESDVMGIAAAMSSVGIESEAGGTAMSTTMKRIGREVEMSGDKLGLFASVAGMSAQDFSHAWGQDAAGALSLFVAGLGNTEHLGMSTNAVLAELGITAQREADSLLRLSGAQGIMNEALALGGQAYSDNTALAAEALARYATTESQMKMAANSIKDAGIEVGQYMLPILADMSAGVADAAGWFSALPDPVKGVITAVGGLGSVTALAVGGTLKLAGSMSDSILAAKRLTEQMPRLGKGIGVAAKAAGVAAIAITGMLMAASYKGESKLGIEELHESIIDLGNGAWATDTLFKNLKFKPGEEMDFGAFLEQLSNPAPMDSFLGGVNKIAASMNGDWANGFNEARTELEAFDGAMATIASTDLESVSRAFESLNMEAGGTGETAQMLLDQMPNLRDALIGVARDAGLATDDATLLKIAMGELVPATDQVSQAALDAQAEVDALGQAFDDQAAAADAAWDALFQWVDGALSSEKAAMNYEAAIDQVTRGLEDNGRTLDITTEKGRANRDVLHGIVEAGRDMIKTQHEQGASEEELQGIMQRTREDLIAAATQYGMSAEEAAAYADQLGLVPENVATEVLLGIQKAQENKDHLMKEISIAGLSLSDWMIDADGKYAIAEADGVKYKIDQKTGEIKIEGKDKNALANAEKIVKKINGDTASVPLSSHGTSQGYANARAFKNHIAAGVTVPVYLSFPGASAAAAQARAAAGRGVPKFAAGGIRKRAWGALDEPMIASGSGAGRFDMSPLGPVNWAEGETGGESFIPHALSKRDRALDIWEETGKILGALPGDGLAAYANAPVSYPVAPTVSVASHGAQIDYGKLAAAIARGQGPSGAQVTINQTNNNPVAEPVSLQTQRVLQSVAALGDLGNV